MPGGGRGVVAGMAVLQYTRGAASHERGRVRPAEEPRLGDRHARISQVQGAAAGLLFLLLLLETSLRCG